MNRQLMYTGELLPATALLNLARDPMIGLAKLAAGLLGTSTQVSGLTCVPTGPASMQVVIGAGEIYELDNIDATAFGDLGTDTHTVLKQGISLDNVNLTVAAPGVAGQSINYLVQASFQDQDTATAVLPYYNASNPASPWLGPSNSGTSQATRRTGAVVISLKAGVAATTGTQTTPSPDSGFVGLWVVTVANGATTVTSGNIAKYSGAPFMTTHTAAIAWLNAVIAGAGLTPDPTTAGQLLTALNTLYSAPAWTSLSGPPVIAGSPIITLADFTAANQNNAAQGYQIFPGGTALQWGSHHIGDIGAGVQTISLSYQFNFIGSARWIGVTLLDAASQVNVVQSLSGLGSSSGFNLQLNELNNAVQDLTALWFAVGVAI